MADGTIGVRLARDWFGPDGSLYLVRDNPHEFPAEYADKPEKADDESDADYKDRLKRQPFATLPSSAEIIGDDARTVAVLQRTANGTDLVVPAMVEKEVKAVGGVLDEKGVEQQNLPVAEAEKGADEQNVAVGGAPRSSGPLPAQATSDKKA